MEQILHLFITNICRHKCPLCCNRLYDIEKIPVVTVERLKSVDTVCLTGGEPLMVNYYVFYHLVEELRTQYSNIKNLYVYTSGEDLFYARYNLKALVRKKYVNGLNVAPKGHLDWQAFRICLREHSEIFKGDSNRLYVFPEQQKNFEKYTKDLSLGNIDVIGRKWDKVFNTPDNEYFERLPILF
jgi:hypothetical protein